MPKCLSVVTRFAPAMILPSMEWSPKLTLLLSSDQQLLGWYCPNRHVNFRLLFSACGSQARGTRVSKDIFFLKFWCRIICGIIGPQTGACLTST